MKICIQSSVQHMAKFYIFCHKQFLLTMISKFINKLIKFKVERFAMKFNVHVHDVAQYSAQRSECC